MKIGIDASRYADSEATGVEWYSFYIINSLMDLILKKKNVDIFLYSKKHLNIHAGKFENKVLDSRRLWTLFKLSREMKKNPPDVLFVPSHVLPLSLPKKSVITIHDVAFKYLRKSYSFFQYHYLNWSTKFAVKKATKIIVPSLSTKNDLIKFFKCPEDKITVISHGFDTPRVKQNEIDEVFEKSEVFKYFKIQKNSKYILFVGRLENKKNLIRLVEAFKYFSEMKPDYSLILAGKRGIGFDQLFKVVAHLNLTEKVIMPGYVTEIEKAALYKYCKIFAFPSLYEGFGFPILEAFYYEKPVLASHVSCLSEVCGNAVHYVDPYDVSLISAGLEKLSNDEKYVEKLVSLGKERLKLFSWNEAAEKTLDVILN
jgi:glycosyltransferase involved in cell wall biosynthesis